MAAKNEGKGTLEAPVLFEEMDGIWLTLQGESRKQHEKSKEMKVAIAYDGAEKTGKKRYRLTNKVATANFETAKKFRIRKEGTKDFLTPCHQRGLGLPEPPEGKEYRQMGAMESNIFTIIGNRMKGRRRNWSIKGGNNLARLLCLKTTGKLGDTLRSLTTLVLPERYAEEIETGLSAAKVPEHEGRGYNGFKQMLIPSSMPWLKGLAAPRPLC